MPKTRQELRSEETKQAILLAARELFAERGYDAVSMREIAKASRCSHTTIYLYFKDKEALLHQLSMAPLQTLLHKMETIIADESVSPDKRLVSTSKDFIQFCLQNRSMYSLFFIAKQSRVDEAVPALEIQKVRNQLFGLLTHALGQSLQLDCTDEQLLAYTRIYFFTLHGVIGTYIYSPESFEMLWERLESTFEMAMEVTLSGCKQIAAKERTQ